MKGVLFLAVFVSHVAVAQMNRSNQKIDLMKDKFNFLSFQHTDRASVIISLQPDRMTVSVPDMSKLEYMPNGLEGEVLVSLDPMPNALAFNSNGVLFSAPPLPSGSLLLPGQQIFLFGQPAFLPCQPASPLEIPVQ